ncbi:urea carboxylase [Phytoactinopolyspora endophytica]|uniref:urea carboxylase n=1 Tax=Phytoactinopolyspora endophytica TaxID=1642495 RepID=UPI00101C9AD0|nr:urea carboxylase [Phytoactinopolyspora endophytica]
MFDSILIANRGEIACRIIATAKRMGLRTVAVYSDADQASAHVRLADTAVMIGSAAPAESYRNAKAVLAAARESGAGAIHPGYGFLSEDAAFARAVADAGLTFVGPTPDQLETFGDKARARKAAQAAGVPMVPGSAELFTVDEAVAAAEEIGYPVMLKASGGGGGIGMQAVHSPDQLRSAFATVSRLAAENFGDSTVFLERFVEHARHVEVQVFGDGTGHVVSLGDRDCSLQRRNQKVIEEAPAPALPDAVREQLDLGARRLASSLSYRSAGTVEFIYDPQREQASFLEVNTRLQVEHGVTELITGVDLVEWMIRLAQGDRTMLDGLGETGPDRHGHAVEARVYAEDPHRDYLPSAGTLTHVTLPATGRADGREVRVDTWIEPGVDVPPVYDPMLAKVLVHADTRDAALNGLGGALRATRVEGVHTNLGLLRSVCADPAVVAVEHTTRTLASVTVSEPRIDVVRPGVQTTVQDWPGRVGYWEVGVPPSGPMDDLSFRLGNAALGNAEGASGLECTFDGPVLRFSTDWTVCVTGAEARVAVDGRPVPQWEPILVPAGAELAVGKADGPGVRSYVLFQGGLDVPLYLGSAATFAQGGVGGYTGRELRTGDVLVPAAVPTDAPSPRPVPAGRRPQIAHDWTVAVTPGPQPAPDYFTVQDMTTIYQATWTVQVHAGRSGVRLTGPRPKWSRSDGGEAGLHPSNLHDNAYSVGSVNFTGDTPALLGPDGPSLGGFACPITVISADRWKLGQLRPDDRVTFRPVDPAMIMNSNRSNSTETVHDHGVTPADAARDDGVLTQIDGGGDRPVVTYRRGGDDNILVEYGPMTLDLGLRMRVHALASELHARKVPGLVDVTPGVRSLHLHTDPDVLSVPRLTGMLQEIERELPATDELVVPSREIHLPLSWNDPVVDEAIARYTTNVRDDALFNPSNIEFIRRINGLGTVDDVRRIVFDAQYLVLGLGDVYLGAPMAVPIDPRHRLVTTKYNPARTWTADATVGIGGSYMCVYGMASPGGYQLVGRTVPIWSGLRQHGLYEPGVPWLLRFFDRIVWEPVSSEELAQIRPDFLSGRHELDVRAGSFAYADYQRLLADNAESISAFASRQSAAFEAERQAWEAAGEFDRDDGAGVVDFGSRRDVALADGESMVEAPMAATVWRMEVEAGQLVEAGQPVATLEAMKLEVPVTAPMAGRVVRTLAAPGDQVPGGAPLVVLAST